jgi:hypothetical protein
LPRIVINERLNIVTARRITFINDEEFRNSLFNVVSLVSFIPSEKYLKYMAIVYSFTLFS